jgi:hypothetical protein
MATKLSFATPAQGVQTGACSSVVTVESQDTLDNPATAMGDVTSVRFELKRSGAAIYIDEFKSLALERIVGRFSAPTSVDAALTVKVDDSQPKSTAK